MAHVIMPLPHRDFDPTEAAVTWRILRDAGHQVSFATPDGERAHADPVMLSGEGLDPWGFLPGLRRVRLIGLMLRAQQGARAAYRAMEQDERFLEPLRYAQLRADDFDALVLPGGHAKGMRPYLEDKTLQALVVAFFSSKMADGPHKPVAAVCHGVLLAARSINPATGKSVLFGRKTTALTWRLEKSAWDLTRWLARFWDPLYYRTYFETSNEPAGYWSVESEIKRLLERADDFLDVPADAPHYLKKTLGMVRDSDTDSTPAWVVRDGNYLSARWPGDVHHFAREFATMLADR